MVEIGTPYIMSKDWNTLFQIKINWLPTNKRKGTPYIYLLLSIEKFIRCSLFDFI